MSNSTTTAKKATAKKATAKGKQATATAKGKTATAKGKTATKKTEKVVFLADGVTGKQFQQYKIDTNKAVKNDIRSFSSAQKFSIKNDMGFYSSIKNFNENDLTSSNLLPLRTTKEKISSDKNGFSAWLFMSLVKRYYSKK